MKNKSIWLDNLEYTPNKAIDKDIDVDVLVIGGGITGLSTCFELINSNLNVALVERNIIGHGVTGKSTAKITFLQELIYSNLEKAYNIDVAKKYLYSQKLAIKHVKEIIKDNNIDCNFEEVDSYLFTNNKKDIMKIKKEKDVLETLGEKALEHNIMPDKEDILYGISLKNTGVFHPLKYLIKLKEIIENNNIKIFENTSIYSINKEDSFICKTKNNIIKAKKVILASHYPYFLFPYLMPLKVHLERSYIAAYKDNNKHFSAITPNKPTESIRYFDDYKICLNGSHNLAFKTNYKKNFNNLLDSFGSNPDYIWSNIDILTSDKLPLVGEIDNDLFIATGYNTWGITNGILAGIIIKNKLLDINDNYSDIFNPKRYLKNKIINYPLNIYSSAYSFINSKINKNKKWYSDKVYLTKDLGIYIDSNNKKHIVYNKCPHLKCSLIFNEIEKTWDCPCHGSRFNIDGKVIEGPSNYSITYKKNK